VVVGRGGVAVEVALVVVVREAPMVELGAMVVAEADDWCHLARECVRGMRGSVD
jgi:hypothetical protein